MGSHGISIDQADLSEMSGSLKRVSYELPATAGCGATPEVSQVGTSRDLQPSPRQLQPSALDRRVCVEPLQVSMQNSFTF